MYTLHDDKDVALSPASFTMTSLTLRNKEAATWQNQQNECEPSEDSDQSLRCQHEETLGP